MDLDRSILLAINGLRTPALDPLMGWLGSWGYLLFPVILIALAMRWRDRASLRTWLDGMLVFLLSLFWVESIVKPLIGRARPSSTEALEGVLQVLGRASSSPSFPSGTATGCAAVAAWIWLRYRGDDIGRAVFVFTALLAFFTSIARVYAGAHWPSDILVGWLAGTLTAIAVDRLAPASPRSRVE